jgi:hypothetical protein
MLNRNLRKKINLIVHDDRMELTEGGEAEENVDDVGRQIWDHIFNLKLLNI